MLVVVEVSILVRDSITGKGRVLGGKSAKNPVSAAGKVDVPAFGIRSKKAEPKPAVPSMLKAEVRAALISMQYTKTSGLNQGRCAGADAKASAEAGCAVHVQGRRGFDILNICTNIPGNSKIDLPMQTPKSSREFPVPSNPKVEVGTSLGRPLIQNIANSGPTGDEYRAGTQAARADYPQGKR